MRPWRVTSTLSMSLRAPNSTRRVSRSELMPCSSGEEVAQPRVGQGCVVCCADGERRESSAQVASRIARSVFVSRCIVATVLVWPEATGDRGPFNPLPVHSC